MTEMVLHGCLELMKRHVIAGKVWVGVGYSGERHEFTHGTGKLEHATALSSNILPIAMIANPSKAPFLTEPPFGQSTLAAIWQILRLQGLGLSFGDIFRPLFAPHVLNLVDQQRRYCHCHQ